MPLLDFLLFWLKMVDAITTKLSPRDNAGTILNCYSFHQFEFVRQFSDANSCESDGGEIGLFFVSLSTSLQEHGTLLRIITVLLNLFVLSLFTCTWYSPTC
jgi:hypothetical protein